jgi:hypothetical protein
MKFADASKLNRKSGVRPTARRGRRGGFGERGAPVRLPPGFLLPMWAYLVSSWLRPLRQ